MAKFTSFDGVDKNGVRAEVNVQVGTGRVKEINGRGRQADDGSYRNVEVVFDPDNPLLKRKVYAMLDTTAKELADYAFAALDDQRTVSFRIESQRKRGVDRTKKFEDLDFTEEVIRVLAALDTVYSHEAKTDPAEDPSNENPSALDQRRQGTAPADTNAATGSVNSDELVAAFTAAAVASAANSAAVASAARAEQFALDHLILQYSEGLKTTVDVSDQMIAQAASLGLVLLGVADDVQAQATHAAPDRAAVSYEHALNLVCDAVARRYPAPLGDGDGAQQDWRTNVTGEASERLYGVMSIAEGTLPLPQAERDSEVTAETVETVETVDITETGDLLAEIDSVDAADTPVSTSVDTAEAVFVHGPGPDDAGFVAPSEDVIGRLRELCVAADVMADPHAIGTWLEVKTGNRVSRRVHGPALEEFVTFYEAAGPEKVRADVQGAASAVAV